jgi:hypothetical protein
LTIRRRCKIAMAMHDGKNFTSVKRRAVVNLTISIF